MKSMKVFAAMFCAAMMFAFTSCSKDFSEDDLIDSWQLKKTVVTETISGLTGEYAQYNGTHTETEYPENGESTTLTFNSDHTCTSTEIGDGGDYSYTSNATWSLNDDKLTITYIEDGETRTEQATIDELDGSKLVMSFSEFYSNEVEPGMTAHAKYTVKMEFEKK